MECSPWFDVQYSILYLHVFVLYHRFLVRIPVTQRSIQVPLFYIVDPSLEPSYTLGLSSLREPGDLLPAGWRAMSSSIEMAGRAVGSPT